jgi:DNA-binding transcriptional ArsR family regulator
MDKVFKALADPTRRELLDRLRAEGGQTLGQLCDRLAMSRQAVAKHLVILEDANLVACIWQGREKLHYLNPLPIHEIAERWIRKFEREQLSALAELKRALEEERPDEAATEESAAKIEQEPPAAVASGATSGSTNVHSGARRERDWKRRDR